MSPFKHPKLKVANDQETLDSPAPLSAGDQFCKHRISNEQTWIQFIAVSYCDKWLKVNFSVFTMCGLKYKHPLFMLCYCVRQWMLSRMYAAIKDGLEIQCKKAASATGEYSTLSIKMYSLNWPGSQCNALSKMYLMQGWNLCVIRGQDKKQKQKNNRKKNIFQLFQHLEGALISNLIKYRVV